MGFSLPWQHGYTPSAATVAGTDLAYNDRIGDEDVARLLFQFRNKPRIVALIRLICGGRLQRIEIVFWQMLVERRLGTAIGRQLDVLGRVVGVDRQGRGDPAYRRRIRTEILVLRSSGSPDQLIRIALAFLGDDATVVSYEETPPAAARFDLEEIDPFDALELARLLFRAKPSGVRLQATWSEGPADERFTLCAVADLPIADDAGRGLGFTGDATIGGRLAGVFLGSE